MDGRAVAVSWFGGCGGSSGWRQKRRFLSPVVSASGFPCCQPRLCDAFEEGPAGERVAIEAFVRRSPLNGILIFI